MYTLNDLNKMSFYVNIYSSKKNILIEILCICYKIRLLYYFFSLISDAPFSSGIGLIPILNIRLVPSLIIMKLNVNMETK